VKTGGGRFKGRSADVKARRRMTSDVLPSARRLV
jgi:hypothetical protein